MDHPISFCSCPYTSTLGVEGSSLYVGESRRIIKYAEKREIGLPSLPWNEDDSKRNLEIFLLALFLLSSPKSRFILLLFWVEFNQLRGPKVQYSYQQQLRDCFLVIYYELLICITAWALNKHLLTILAPQPLVQSKIGLGEIMMVMQTFIGCGLKREKKSIDHFQTVFFLLSFTGQ